MVTAGLLTRHGHDLRLLIVLLGVQHRVRDPPDLQFFAQLLGNVDGDGAHQHGLALGVQRFDLVDDGLEFLALGLVDHVREVGAHHGLVRGDHHDVQVVDLLELRRLRVGRAGHAGQLLVHAEVVLERDGGQRLVLVFDLDPFLGLQGLVQPLAVAPPGHQPAGELVDDDDFAVFYDVIDVQLEKRVGLEGLGDVMQQFDAAGVIEVFHLHELLAPRDPLLAQGRRARLFVDHVVLIPREPGDQAVHLVIQVGGLLRRPGDDERGAGLIDQDAVDLVHDGVVELALHQALPVELHVVPQVVEAELVVGAVGDVGAVGNLALGVRHPVDDRAHLQPEEAVDVPHPLGVAPGQVVVDRHDVHSAAAQGVQVGRQGCHQGLAFTGFHFGDLALVQHDAADQLHVEMPHLEAAHRGFAHGREGLRQEVVERLPPFAPFFEPAGQGP